MADGGRSGGSEPGPSRTCWTGEEGTGSEGSKKVRKTYTITKQRENWTASEHQKFLEAVELYVDATAVEELEGTRKNGMRCEECKRWKTTVPMRPENEPNLNREREDAHEKSIMYDATRYDRDWKKIEAYVGTKTVIQIRSHAQKHFLKVMKNKTGEHVPPPRPKRKSANPYPHKAPDPGPSTERSTVSRAPDVNFTAQTTTQEQSAAPSLRTFSENTAGPSFQGEEQGDRCAKINSSLPNFAEVYRVLGELFDPSSSLSGEMLFRLPPMEKETLTLLSRNLTANLHSEQVWEDHMRIVNQQQTSKDSPQACRTAWQVKRGSNRVQHHTGEKQKSRKGKVPKKKSKQSGMDGRGERMKG